MNNKTIRAVWAGHFNMLGFKLADNTNVLHRQNPVKDPQTYETSELAMADAIEKFPVGGFYDGGLITATEELEDRLELTLA